MIYIADNAGFIQTIAPRINSHGGIVHDITHCASIRFALPFTSRRAAEDLYAQTYLAGRWHTTVSTSYQVPISRIHTTLRQMVDIVLAELPHDDLRYQQAVEADLLLKQLL